VSIFEIFGVNFATHVRKNLDLEEKELDTKDTTFLF
jgi:hypothetical protein